MTHVLSPGPDQQSMSSSPWLIWLVVGCVGGLLWMACCVLSVWLFRRRRGKDTKLTKLNKLSQAGLYSGQY